MSCATARCAGLWTSLQDVDREPRVRDRDIVPVCLWSRTTIAVFVIDCRPDSPARTSRNSPVGGVSIFRHRSLARAGLRCLGHGEDFPRLATCYIV
jgi:hypothetical protein